MALAGAPLGLVIAMGLIFALLLTFLIWGIVVVAQAPMDNAYARNLAIYSIAASVAMIVLFISFVALIAASGASALVGVFKKTATSGGEFESLVAGDVDAGSDADRSLFRRAVRRGARYLDENPDVKDALRRRGAEVLSDERIGKAEQVARRQAARFAATAAAAK